MIRRMVGAALDVSTKKMTLKDLQIALEQRDPNHRFMMAPSCGLMLYHIDY